MPDIEKRLEAFVRLAHGIVVFPGGAGTAEEILYLLGILLDPANREQPLPGRAHGAGARARPISSTSAASSPARSASEALQRLTSSSTIPPAWRASMVRGMDAVREFRKPRSDSYNFNWLLSVPAEFQQPFEVTHESMRALELQSRPAGARARRESAPRVLRHRHRQREGIRASRRSRRTGPYELVRRSRRSWSCSMSCWQRSSRSSA